MAVGTYMTAPKVSTSPLTGGGRKNQYTAAQPKPQLMDTPTANTGVAAGLSGQSNTSKTSPLTGGGRNNQYTSAPTTYGPTTGGNWNLPSWNPSTPQVNIPPGNTSIRAGVEKDFFGGDPNIFNPDAFKSNDSQTANYISSVLPVAQFGQNNYQYRNDFDEAQRRFNAEFGLTQNQNTYQQGLSTRQQQSAEEQARIAAQQWQSQFGHTQNMDLQGLDLSRTQVGNEYRMGMDRNQADRDVAGTYANSNMYQANQQLAGTRYASDQDRVAAMYGADQGLKQAGMYSDAQRYQAQLGLQEAQGYAGAQRYGADQTLAGQRYQAQLGLQEAQGYAGAQRYGADQGLQGQRYMADQGLAEAGLYSGAQRYGTDAQERMNQALMANNLSVAGMQAYGRSQAPVANWSRSWG